MCVFCKIINKEIPAYTLYENDYVIFTSSSGRSLEGFMYTRTNLSLQNTTQNECNRESEDLLWNE